MRPILGSLEADERTQYLQIAGLVLATVVFVRIAWVFAYNGIAALKRRLFGAGSWPGEFVPTFAGMSIVSWCGMRGIVTLATAFALPRQRPTLIPLSRAHPALRIRRGRRNARRAGSHAAAVDRAVRPQGRRHRGKFIAPQAARVAAEIIDKDDSMPRKCCARNSRCRATPRCRWIADRDNVARASSPRNALVRLRRAAEIGDDAFHRIEERLDRVEVNVR